MSVDSFFWCPEAAYGDEARKRAAELAAVARNGYQISARTLERISERDRPDGLLSLDAFDGKAITLDQVRVTLRANVDLPDEALHDPAVLEELYRSAYEREFGNQSVLLCSRLTQEAVPFPVTV